MQLLFRCGSLILLAAFVSIGLGANSSLEGIEEIGLRVDVRIDDKTAVGRVDQEYIRSLVPWQLDQYRIKVVQDDPGLPFLSVKVRVSRILGPAHLIEGDEQVDGVFQATIQIEFQQMVTTVRQPEVQFWNATFRRERTETARGSEELQKTLIRGLERNLFAFIHSFRRANPEAPAQKSATREDG